jgi:YbbR domain-containing protein
MMGAWKNNWGLRLVALLMAVLLWLYVRNRVL